MADSTDTQQRQREEEHLHVGAVDIQIQSEADDSSDNPPPEYATVLGEGGAGTEGEENGAQPLSYEAAMAGDGPSQPPPSTKVLTAEAPPSYLQLFGSKEEEEETDGVGRRRRHRRLEDDDDDAGRTGYLRLLNLIPTDRKSAYRCGAVMVLLLLLTVLSLCMIVVGFVHYNQCSVQEVPLYLIVGGIFLLVEIVLHSLLWTAQKLSNDEPVYNLIKKFDCIALFLIVWLVVGSAWIFKAGRDSLCSDIVDQVTVPPVNVTTTTGDVEDPDPLLESGAECEDCPSGVYVFTVFLILFQYLMILLLGICCCTSSIRYRRH